MYGRAGLDRFKKAQSSEPFSVTHNSSPKPALVNVPNSHLQSQHQKPEAGPLVSPSPHVTQIGGGQSNWQPPDWAIEPRSGVYYLEVLKDGEVLDRINLDRRRQLFGRQFHACDYVLDHQSVSRQHAAVIPHKNGSVFVIDLGSAHGTFVANERLTKDSPVELEVGQSLRFAASTRTYVLRKNNAALFPPAPLPTEIDLPPSPDPNDEEAVVAYNTFLNRYCLTKPNKQSLSAKDEKPTERPKKRIKKTRVSFRDQVGGELVEVVGYSDGADVETEPGPMGVKEGSLVGKYESLVQITVIPKGKEQSSVSKTNVSSNDVTDKLKEVLNKVKNNSNTTKSGIYDDLYGDSFSAGVGSTTWAYSSHSKEVSDTNKTDDDVFRGRNEKKITKSNDDSDDDDLFGD
ncbi:protein phosphatase 1 regulatory inhibitor subunit PPP1R8 homolog [Impatiens glandulifera]|uniref:protein phosphatase 1 regulatory inhibitor subunit PPP1R8 homolog n=1 Tax=Impatiens glandulifera TaxID=253017 RepID=UPI001FB073E9|nr:protein phosphatase 1 regulatory inhibitor subunit PPP1R8 homolog [Impatiens glandulifera]